MSLRQRIRCLFGRHEMEDRVVLIPSEEDLWEVLICGTFPHYQQCRNCRLQTRTLRPSQRRGAL